MKKLLSTALCLICLFSFCLTGLAETAEADYLGQIPGTYVELFPELSKEEYHDDLLAAVTPLVGEENAEATVEYLLYMCTGDVYGEEAIAKYSADPESMRFDCCYIGGVAKMTIEGNVISGVDAEGNEIFRHTYAPVEVENNENGFIFYKTEDEKPLAHGSGYGGISNFLRRLETIGAYSYAGGGIHRSKGYFSI